MAGTGRGVHRVTIVDVARASGFSASTVSIVLNDAPLSRYVAASTKARIRKAAQTMGYRPDVFARSLRKRQSRTIGVIVFDLSDPFCTLIFRGIERALTPTSYLPIIMDAHNERKSLDRYLDSMLERRVDGLIIVANWLFAGFELSPEFGKNRIPVVAVGRDMSRNSISSIQVDNDAGGYAAAGHLYNLGHRRIAFLRGPGRLSDSMERWKGIRRFMTAKKLAIAPELVVQFRGTLDPFSNFESGYALTRQLLAGSTRFTAVVAFDDLTAMGAMRAIQEAGRRVPGDYSVIGFDDVPYAALLTPPLTTIRQPMEDMGQLAGRWMLQELEEEGKARPALPALKQLAPVLVERESTAPPGKKRGGIPT